MPKVEHSKYTGDVMLNDDECQKSAHLTFITIHCYSVDCMHTGGGGRLWKQPLAQLSDLCDLGLGHCQALSHQTQWDAPHCVALINLFTSSVSETTMVTLFCQILQEKEKTYF